MKMNICRFLFSTFLHKVRIKSKFYTCFFSRFSEQNVRYRLKFVVFSMFLHKVRITSQFYPGFSKVFPRFSTGVRRITARERSTVTCASKTPSKIDKNMLNLHFVREWHTFFWAQSQLKMQIRRFFQCFCLKIAQK